MRRLPGLVLAVALVAACQPTRGVTPRPVVRATAKPGAAATAAPLAAPARAAIAAAARGLATRVVPQAGAAVTVTGTARIIANNGGGVVSDHGGGYRLRQAAKLAEAAVAAAAVTLHDAGGQVLVDEAGTPLAAYTDKAGGYRLTAVLPAGGVVMKIKLAGGGELSALLGAGATAQDVDTASSLGAAYVLDQYVRGDQKVLDKLPAGEAQRLQRELGAANDEVPTYEATALIAQVGRLRAKAPALDRTLKDIQALLIGQANLGSGLPATEVALLQPSALAWGPDGRLFIAEKRMGRIREVAPDGTIAVLADVQRGRVKQNFLGANAMVAGPDGSLYVARSENDVSRIRPDGRVELVAGIDDKSLPADRVPFGGQATRVRLRPTALALGPDGTLYVACHRKDPAPALVVAIGADGLARPVFEGVYPTGYISGLAFRDGTFTYVERESEGGGNRRLGRRTAAGPDATLGEGPQFATVAEAGDGNFVVAEDGYRAVALYGADGARRAVLAGYGGPAGGPEVLQPGPILVTPAGEVRVIDQGTGLVLGGKLDGSGWRTVAGTSRVSLATGGTGAIPLNAPGGVAFDAAGNMLIADAGSHVVKRLVGDRLELVAGGGVGDHVRDEGVAGPQAQLLSPTGLLMAGSELLVVDRGYARLRALGADTTLRTLVGPPGANVYLGGTSQLGPDEAVPAAQYRLDGDFLARSAAGTLYLSSKGHQQVVRLDADGRIRLVAGRAPTSHTASAYRGEVTLPVTDGEPARPRVIGAPMGLAFGPDGALYVAEFLGGRILKVTDPGGDAPTVSRFAGVSLPELVADPDPNALGDEGNAAARTLIPAPIALCFDAAGNLYYSQLGTSSVAAVSADYPTGVPWPADLPPIYAKVRKVSPDGKITTVAGPNGKFFTDPAAEDALVLPSALAIDPAGRLVIVDVGANLVRILPAGSF